MLITVMLYVTIYLGLIFQVVLAVFQVIAAVIILLFWYDLEKKDRIKLLFYWLMVFVFAVCCYMEWFDFMVYEIFQMAIFPIFIADFFTFFLEKLVIEESDLE